MFERAVDYPTAVASYDDAGVAAAIDWCLRRMQGGDTLTVWTSQKSNLGNCAPLEQLMRHSNVEHVTGRGGGGVRGPGPVLMAWAHMDDIGKLIRSGHAGDVRGLCVITWNADWLRPWVAAVGPELLGDRSPWDTAAPELDPLIVEALRALTSVINHSNSIEAAFEKDMVGGAPLALHDARIEMDGAGMQAWALAHGWSGGNPERLARYVKDIGAGKRPRCRHVLRADYVQELRRRVAENAQS